VTFSEIGCIIYIIMGRIERKHFLKFLAGFIALVSLGLIGALATGLYEINQEDTAIMFESLK